MSRENGLERMAHMAEGAADMAVTGALSGALTGQRMAMSVLLAEMRALSALMPGQSAAHEEATTAEAEARHRAEEAEVEAGFDNMPV